MRPSPRSLLAGVLALAVALAAAGCGSSPGTPVKLSAGGARGKAIASQQHCSSCHTTDGSRSEGPTWKDLAGSQVPLDGGKTVTATDAYLRRSILEPGAQVASGYGMSMPNAFSGLSPSEVADLLAYMHDISSKDGTPVRR